MPKQKPHKGLLKRIKITATGKILRRKANKRHLMSTKSAKRRRRLGRPALVDGTNVKVIRQLLKLQ